GSFKDVSATDLGVHASQAAMKAAGVQPTDIQHVIFGAVIQSEASSIYSPRHIGLKCQIPKEVPALGVNRLCGSGFESWVQACLLIRSGEAKICLAGGVEQMSSIPFIARGARWGYRMGHAQLEDYMTAALTDIYVGAPMAITAENLAEKYKISRTEVDEYALRSQTTYAAAFKNGIFKKEIAPYTLTTKKGVTLVENDEHPKPESTMQTLAGLKAVFKKDGVVTAGNASGIVDGAAASILMSKQECVKRGLTPLAKVVSWASVGCDPAIMGIGPVLAMSRALAKAELKMDQVDLIEVNEAFAAQYLAVERELKLPRERVNINGGAIAVGHPLGASGTRIMNHLTHELGRTGARYAIGAACIGGGQGIAVVLERC
ncbi:MAG: acetyl-CoA C-acetyltransferase, partial [Bdellovibrionales bacterium]|nr:acetyl-CoA C-acetyltransferase [Bdellovibrionales bacterium]